VKVLQVHCRYLLPGGEDRSAAAEAVLLRRRGHEVVDFCVSNADAVGGGSYRLARALLASAWNRSMGERLRTAIRQHRPHLVSVQNFWFAVSPAVFGAAWSEGVPAVLTLRNYRLICPGALLMRANRPCEHCVGRSPWLAVARRCYRGSALQTALVARMVSSNRRRGTWGRMISAYIALTEFSRSRFIAGGIPAERIHVKPNFLMEDPGVVAQPGDGAVFVGRLSPEKGLEGLLDAWNAVPAPLSVVGEGPLRQWAMARSAGRPIRVLGQLRAADVVASIKAVRLLVMPSIWYECFPRVLLEAYACGRPVVASRLGSMAEIVKDGETGLLFEPGNPADLAAKVRWLLDRPEEQLRMGRNARAEFEARYTAERNYDQLMSIYQKAIAESESSHGRAVVLGGPR